MNKHKIKIKFQISLDFSKCKELYENRKRFEQTEGIADMEVSSGGPDSVEFGFVGCRDSPTNVAANWEFDSADGGSDGGDCKEKEPEKMQNCMGSERISGIGSHFFARERLEEGGGDLYGVGG